MSTGPNDQDDTYGDYSVDESDQLTNEDTLADGDIEDQLDRGYSPPESYSPGQGYGNTPYEEATGESLDQRVAQEVPEPDPYAEAEAEEGREQVGGDVGIDGAAASAEEAAMHIIPDDATQA